MDVVVQSLSKSFGEDVLAVNGLNLEVKSGEFIVLLGPSGCGKTTALRMIAGLETPTSGDILFGGKSVLKLPPKDRNIAMVFQDYALYPQMTVAENLSFPLRIRKVPQATIESKVTSVLELLRIPELKKRYPRQLSGGQKQRVALGRALVREPSVFLMDEPLSNIDAKMRVVMRTEMKRLFAGFGVTVFYVTHDQVEAMALGDRVAVMYGGRLQQVAPPGEVYDRPANLFIAGFVGCPPMNTFPAAVLTGAGDLVLRAGQCSVPCPPTLAAGLRRAGVKEGHLGIRPEHLHCVPASERGIVLRGRVEVVEPLGQDTYIYVEAGLGEVCVVRTESRERHSAGEEVGLAFSPENLHFFQAGSGARVA